MLEVVKEDYESKIKDAALQTKKAQDEHEAKVFLVWKQLIRQDE
mgnify:CR=1 FL=1